MLAALMQQVPGGSVDPAAPSGTESTGLATPDVPWSYLAPVLILFIGALLGLAAVALLRRRVPAHVSAAYTVLVSGAAFASVIPLWHRVGNPEEGAISAVAGAVGIDRFSLFASALICLSVLLVALLSDGYLRREGLDGPELYLLMLMAAAGGLIMVAANDLIVLFIGIEVLSIATYVLAAMHARRVSSQESGFKYFVLGSFASAFLLYGIAFVYGATGSTSLLHIQSFLSERVLTDNGTLLLGLALMMVGFGFKVAAAPFHQWSPDVYQGAPSPITAFMASAVKAAAFAAMLRVFVVGFASYEELWSPIVFVLSVLSMLVGAILGVRQRNVKRLLAYSSVSHAGFLLIGVEAASARGTAATLFYLLCYAAMTIGSFGVVTVIGRTGDGRHDLGDYRGLGRARPGLALLFTVFLLAQAGTPFTAGFIAKFGVIQAAAEREHWVLAGVAMLSTAISAFVYLRVIVAMYFAGGGEHGDEPVEFAGPPVVVPRGAAAALAAALIATLVIGVVPGPFTDLASRALPEFVQPNGR